MKGPMTDRMSWREEQEKNKDVNILKASVRSSGTTIEGP